MTQGNTEQNASQEFSVAAICSRAGRKTRLHKHRLQASPATETAEPQSLEALLKGMFPNASPTIIRAAVLHAGGDTERAVDGVISRLHQKVSREERVHRKQAASPAQQPSPTGSFPFKIAIRKRKPRAKPYPNKRMKPTPEGSAKGFSAPAQREAQPSPFAGLEPDNQAAEASFSVLRSRKRNKPATDAGAFVVDQLAAMFPTISRQKLGKVLLEHGSLEEAVNVLCRSEEQQRAREQRLLKKAGPRSRQNCRTMTNDGASTEENDRCQGEGKVGKKRGPETTKQKEHERRRLRKANKTARERRSGQ